MNYVTISKIISHTGKSRSAVERAMKAAGVKVLKQKGVKGLRIEAREANRFIAKQWPGVGEL